MAQNRSHAVMAQRHEPHDSLDFFGTPPWGTRALCEMLDRSIDLSRLTVWEPACGTGDMARPLAEYFSAVRASDVHDYGCGYEVRDFLWPMDDVDLPHFIISNPPFNLAEQFIEYALGRAQIGVAMLVRSSFCESVGRYQRLFSRKPPQAEYVFVERLPIVRGSGISARPQSRT